MGVRTILEAHEERFCDICFNNNKNYEKYNLHKCQICGRDVCELHSACLRYKIQNGNFIMVTICVEHMPENMLPKELLKQ